MPVIDVSLHEATLIDAQVVLSFTHLHDLLRKVIDSNNSHQHEIDELKQMLKDERERGDMLERHIGEGMASTKANEKLRKIGDVDRDLTTLQEQVESMKKAHDRERHENNLLNNARFDSLEKDHAKSAATIDREAKDGALTTGKHEEKIKFLEKRLDSISIPDLRPFESAIADYKLFKEAYEVKIKTCQYFVDCWEADPAKLAQLCCSRSMTTKEILSSSQQDRTDYILSLPPFGECSTQFKACDDFQRAAIDKRLAAVGIFDGGKAGGVSGTVAGKGSGGFGGGASFDSRGDLAALAGEVKTQQQAAKNALDFLDRRMKDSETLARRVAALEENAKALGIHKADVGLVQNKADVDKITVISRQITDLRDDVGDILDRMSKGGSTSGGGGGGGASGSLNAAGSELVPRSGTVTDELKRRMTELEVEAARLETRKADRTELQRFYQFLESVDPEAVRRKAFPNSSPIRTPLPVITSSPTGASPNNTSGLLTPQRPHTSGSGGAAQTAGALNQRPGTTSPNKVAGGSPRGVFLGRSVAVVRDASGSATPASIGTTMH